MLALVLGFIISAGLYVSYLWPVVDPVDGPVEGEPPARGPGESAGPPPAVASDDAASAAP